MKVYISYSSRDTWISRRLSDDLVALGCETFLDQKDIEAGDQFDDVIDSNLIECDEMLVLLSPSSLKSDWVLIEIGGARALRKRVVPILLHIGANELPNPISKHHAIDINKIDVYYEQVKERLAEAAAQRKKTAKKKAAKKAPLKKKTAAKKKPPPKKRTPKLSIGDKVRLPWVRPPDAEVGAAYYIWEDHVDTFFDNRQLLQISIQNERK